MSRRAFLTAVLAAPLAAQSGTSPAWAEAVAPVVPRGAPPTLRVFPRQAWAQGRVAGEPAQREQVRFLLVHHTASSNQYRRDQVPGLLRGFFDFHTGPERRFPDLAYNFLVDSYGGVWEGRTGSLAGPVRGSATGGSQGFAQLACFIGDHSTTAPTGAARRSMLNLLAWLAERSEIDTRPGATVSFPSRGSSLWAPGATVVARTVSAHRDMSQTTCPGDALYADVLHSFPDEITALRKSAGPPAPSGAAAPSPVAKGVVPPATAPPTGAAAGPVSGGRQVPRPTGTAAPSTAASPSSTAPPSTSASPATSAAGPPPADDHQTLVRTAGLAAVGAGVAATVAGLKAANR